MTVGGMATAMMGWYEHDPETHAAEDPGEPAERGAEATRASAGSSPSHRSATSQVAPVTPQPEAEPQGPLDELSLADSFLLGVLRGWRLLQAAGLTPEEKRDILSTSKNSLEYEVIASALQTLWDEQLLGQRHFMSHSGSYHAHLAEGQDEDHLYYQNAEDEWWGEDDWWYRGLLHGQWMVGRCLAT